MTDVTSLTLLLDFLFIPIIKPIVYPGCRALKDVALPDSVFIFCLHLCDVLLILSRCWLIPSLCFSIIRTRYLCGCPPWPQALHSNQCCLDYDSHLHHQVARTQDPGPQPELQICKLRVSLHIWRVPREAATAGPWTALRNAAQSSLPESWILAHLSHPQGRLTLFQRSSSPR